MTTVTGSVSTAATEDDTNPDAFQGKNTPTLTQAIFGNVFLGINRDFLVRFRGHNIPKNATITAASIDLVASQTNSSASPTVQINATVHGPAVQRWKSVQPVGRTGWASDFWTNFKAHVRTPALATIDNPLPGAVSSAWALRNVGGQRLRMSQRFTPAATNTLGSILMNMQRGGNPTGDLVVEIHTSVGGFPSEVILAKSDPVLATSVPLGVADINFAFTGLDQIVLVSGTEYQIVLTATYPPSVFNFVTWRAQRQFFSVSRARIYSDPDFGWGNGNYPGTADAYLAARTVLGTNTPWTVPLFVLGTTYTTSSLVALLQQVVDDPFYQQGDPITFVFISNGNTGQRRVALFDHATLAAPALNYTYDLPPVHRVVSARARADRQITNPGKVLRAILHSSAVAQAVTSQGSTTQSIIGKAIARRQRP